MFRVGTQQPQHPELYIVYAQRQEWTERRILSAAQQTQKCAMLMKQQPHRCIRHRTRPYEHRPQHSEGDHKHTYQQPERRPVAGLPWLRCYRLRRLTAIDCADLLRIWCSYSCLENMSRCVTKTKVTRCSHPSTHQAYCL